MKNLLLFLALFITYYGSSGQTYNPTNFTISNKAYGIAQAAPTDARSYFYDASLFIQRPYQSTAEVLSYLNLAKYRVGQFPIYVSSGTLQSGGTFTGGTITEYYFRDGTSNSSLVAKNSLANNQTGFYPTSRITERDSIKNRVVGMMSTVSETGQTYQLQNGILNSNWVNVTPAKVSEIPQAFDAPHGYNLIKKGIVIPKGGFGAWDSIAVESPVVFFDNKAGIYKMVHTGYGYLGGDSIQPRVGLATSVDLENWVKSPNPIFNPSGVPGSPDYGGATGPFVYPTDSLYYLFYIGVTQKGYEGGKKSICLATSKTLTDTSTWTRYGTIIDTSSAGTGWRSDAVYHPDIIKNGSTYYMFFNSQGRHSVGGNRETIGYATSVDLKHWVVDDINSPVIDANISDTTSWENKMVGDPSVYKINGTWYMSYFGVDKNDHTASDGIASTTESLFPLGWKKYPSNPVLTSGSYFDFIYAHKPFIYITPTKYYHFYTAVGNDRQIALAYQTLPILGELRNQIINHSTGRGLLVRYEESLTDSLKIDASSVQAFGSDSTFKVNFSGGNIMLGHDKQIKLTVSGDQQNTYSKNGLVLNYIGNNDSLKIGASGIDAYNANGHSTFFLNRIKGTVAINTISPDTSAALDINSPNKGLLIPRLSSTQMNAIPNPGRGLIIWNTSDSNIYQYRGFSGWRAVGGAGGSLDSSTFATNYSRDTALQAVRFFTRISNALYYPLGDFNIQNGNFTQSAGSGFNSFEKETHFATTGNYAGYFNGVIALGPNYSGSQTAIIKYNTTLDGLYIGTWGEAKQVRIGGSNVILGMGEGGTFSGSVGVGTITPNSSALLDLTSTTKALLLPRMTKAERDAITKVAGLAIYQTDNTPGLRVCDGSNWVRYTETTD